MIAEVMKEENLKLGKGFDRRIVRYEEVHSIRQGDFDLFCSAISLQDGSTILDLGCGYGAISRELHARNSAVSAKYLLLDSSTVQLGRAQVELEERCGHSFVEEQTTLLHYKFPQHPFRSQSIDYVVAKMFLHELPQQEQPRALAEIHDLLKPHGVLVLWEAALSPISAEFIRRAIRQKDRLCGFDDLVRDRHFLIRDELHGVIREASFKHTAVVGEIPYTFDTSRRLIPEFGGDEPMYHAWLDFIRSEAAGSSPAVLAEVGFKDLGNTITFTFPKIVLRTAKD